MKNLKSVKIFLFATGMIGIIIGASLLLIPIAFEASAGIHLDNEVNILSEVRAPGGTLMAAGLLIASGAFISGMTYISIVLAALFYLSYGLSRTISIILDGLPTDTLVMATVSEIIIGLMSLYILFKFPKPQYHGANLQ
ncbi:MAG: DUF4345 domain-containing protein [Sporocytophaga sp.]|uniref:DUF4345 domain-containing protein n=1 Tax=Sporocytophaga sp. TaxID=2231183 RepID=UPI001B2C147A|nr:DUF4345 domain-containing protein [Sporocytophaga sp.]MBO9701023.1 DUF4345 domain-containing protein [Sporocytophaga sp.]